MLTMISTFSIYSYFSSHYLLFIMEKEFRIYIHYISFDVLFMVVVITVIFMVIDTYSMVDFDY